MSVCGVGWGELFRADPESPASAPPVIQKEFANYDQICVPMTDLPLILAGVVAVIAIVLAIVSGWAWLIIAAGAIAAAVVIYMRRQRA